MSALCAEGPSSCDIPLARGKKVVLLRSVEQAFEVRTGARIKQPRALIVEDHADTRELYKYHLKQLGWHAESVESGAEALFVAPLFRPDVIVMDLAMADLDGFEAIKRLKLEPRTAGVPIVVVTGHGTQSNIDRAHRLGAAAVLTKPYPPDDLRWVLEDAMRGCVVPRSQRASG